MHGVTELAKMRRLVEKLGAVIQCCVVTMAVIQLLQPVFSLRQARRMVHLFRYFLQPYSNIWLYLFYFQCGIVVAVTFYYLTVVFGRDIQDPFTEMAGCGKCAGCRTEGAIKFCDYDPVNRIKDMHKDCYRLSHFAEAFSEMLTRDDVASIRQWLHQMKVLSISESYQLITQCHGSITDSCLDMLLKLLGMLDKKDNGYEKLIEVLEANAEENNWFTDLAEQLKTRLRNVCQNLGPILFTDEFKRFELAKETWTIESTTMEIDWQECGIRLSFPKCFTRGEATIRVCFNGQFKLPPGTELVSPVYCVTTVGILNKQIKVEIRHYIVLNKQSDEKLLNFVKAEPTDPHEPCSMYDMQIYSPDTGLTCFNTFQQGMTVVSLSKAPVHCFLIAVVKSKKKHFSNSRPCSYRMQLLFSKHNYCNAQEWVPSIAASNKDLNSFTEVLKKQAGYQFCIAGPSIEACSLDEDGFLIQLPMRGVVMPKGQWRLINLKGESQLSNTDSTTQTLLDEDTAASNQQELHPEKKFNIVIKGIPENAQGTSRHDRIRADKTACTKVIQITHPEFTETSIRHCTRLGKYEVSTNRPILVNLTRLQDQSTILRNQKKLVNTNYSIKREMTKQEQAIESVLLRERRELIELGHERKSIKLDGVSIYLNGEKYGSVSSNCEFKKCSHSSQATTDNTEAELH